MLLIVVWKNKTPFKLEIDGSKTVLELKQKIASHFNETYTGFNILNGTEIIDNTKENNTIESCNINRLIRLPDNYEPGLK
jgi:hypothetical protein